MLDFRYDWRKKTILNGRKTYIHIPLPNATYKDTRVIIDSFFTSMDVYLFKLQIYVV